MEGESHRGSQLCFRWTTASRWLKMRERSELLQLDFQGYPLFKKVLEKDKLCVIFFLFSFVCGDRSQKENTVILRTFSCCCSSLLSRANTVFVSLFLLIEAWIAFLSFPTDLKTHKYNTFYSSVINKQINNNLL